MSYLPLSASRPTARKEHLCIWCPEKILVGECYVKRAGVYEGEFQSDHFHAECCEASQKFFKESQESDFPPHAFKRGTLDER